MSRVLVLRAAGVNCNEETAYAFEMAGAETRQIHVNRLLEKPSLLDEFGAVAIPGGFSYGDDISAGRILGLEIATVLGDAFRTLLARGGLVLGICNGFQVLMKSGLLPDSGGNTDSINATLVDNDSHRYEDRWVRMEVNSGKSLFLGDDEPIDLPIAHAEGRFTVGSESDLNALHAGDRVVLRYADPTSNRPTETYPLNPNGSDGAIAGICDSSGQVLGLMPHPERFLFKWQHPRWTREGHRRVGDGLRLFENAVKNLRS